MFEHVGKMLAAAARYGIEAADWLDLSTGINPAGWPVPSTPPAVWQRLPEQEDGLARARLADLQRSHGLTHHETGWAQLAVALAA